MYTEPIRVFEILLVDRKLGLYFDPKTILKIKKSNDFSYILPFSCVLNNGFLIYCYVADEMLKHTSPKHVERVVWNYSIYKSWEFPTNEVLLRNLGAIFGSVLAFCRPSWAVLKFLRCVDSVYGSRRIWQRNKTARRKNPVDTFDALRFSTTRVCLSRVLSRPGWNVKISLLHVQRSS